jgi:hypothetical protein
MSFVVVNISKQRDNFIVKKRVLIVVWGVLAHVCGYDNDDLSNQKCLHTYLFGKVPPEVQGPASTNRIVRKLTHMNDIQRKSFVEIADYIEQNL